MAWSDAPEAARFRPLPARISTGWNQPRGTRTFQPLAPVRLDAMAAFMHRFNQKGLVKAK